jgi:uncharacterized spore protein YtfJ
MTTNVETKSALSPTEDTMPVEPMERFFAAAQPGTVFSEPVTQGAYTVITAREVTFGGGYGFGGGCGPAPQPSGESTTTVAGGRGGGAGGGSMGRPIAAIIIGPDGVKVQPIVDVTKFLLAALGAMGAVAAAGRRSSRARKGS